MRNVLALVSLLLLVRGAAAQVLPAPPGAVTGPDPTRTIADLKAKEKDKKAKEGWTNQLTVGSNVAYNHSSSVVGKPDGTTVSLGLAASGRFSYLRGPHEWLNLLTVQVQHTKTPLVDAFVKSLDLFRFESAYLYHFESLKRLSLYAGLSFETQLFGGEDIRPTPVTYREAGAPPFATARLLLTRELSPTLVGQSAGVQLNIADEKALKATLRVGVAAVEALTRRGLVIADDAATPEIELSRLEDYAQAGGQLRFEVTGTRQELVAYSLTADFLFPFYNSVSRGLSGADLINIDVMFKLGFKVAKWMSLDYVLGVRRVPLVADVFQVWNGLMAAFTFTVL